MVLGMKLAGTYEYDETFANQLSDDYIVCVYKA